MKKMLMLLAAILMPIIALSAGTAPRIIQCGIDPVTIRPGENFTLFADVADPDGFSDVAEVNLLVSNKVVLKIPQTPADSSRFAQMFTMPESVDVGTYTLSMVAVDSKHASSDVSFFLQGPLEIQERRALHEEHRERPQRRIRHGIRDIARALVGKTLDHRPKKLHQAAEGIGAQVGAEREAHRHWELACTFPSSYTGNAIRCLVPINANTSRRH